MSVAGFTAAGGIHGFYCFYHSKVTIHTILLQKNAVLFELSINQRNPEKMYRVSLQKYQAVFNIDTNKKCSLSTKSAYYNDF